MGGRLRFSVESGKVHKSVLGYYPDYLRPSYQESARRRRSIETITKLIFKIMLRKWRDKSSRD